MIPPRNARLNAFAFTGVALLLAGCSIPLVALRATGQPSLSLNAPLTTVACTTSGACIALGASGGATPPNTAAQVRNRKGVWSSLRVPSTPLASFDAGACAATRCIFGGERDTGELLWSVDANSGVVSSLRGPAGGLAVRNLSCVSDLECVAIDQAVRGLTRISFTRNSGTTWSPARTVAWAAHSTTVLTCPGFGRCYLAATSPSHRVVVRETLNRGATWTLVSTLATWRSLAALQCAATCTALVNGSAIATQVPKAATKKRPASTVWTQTPLSFQASALACAGSSPCLAIGSASTQDAAMARWQTGKARAVTLSYVPSALTGVACQVTVCVAIGVSTVVALQP